MRSHHYSDTECHHRVPRHDDALRVRDRGVQQGDQDRPYLHTAGNFGGKFPNKGLGFIWECEAAAAALNDLTRVSPPHRHSLLAGQAVPLYSPMIPLPAPHACLAPKLP